ncbi:MAG: DUF2510 domain-containing protein [Ilumatobacter sp.]|uniref:DUF2510 domain-containing protein n=1 Tax=Ilumatobacter sp. TaxID=1967498 RepID=UPI00262F53F3|nr:DUF2510 domain-containing protein [Ilumatobacter sp.]MDJ0767480.1 DUF2510 domain-containing protein [Ilumatobacter sp.]
MTDSYSSPGAGWFPDPLGRHEHRYFNGTQWTADVAEGGQRFVDPLGTDPGPRPGAPPGAQPFPGGQQARNGLATAALVCGILGMLFAWIPFIFVVGLVLAILAIVFGIRGLRKSNVVHVGRGPSITGIVTGLIGLALAVVGIALSVVLYRAVDDFASPGPVVTDVASCDVDGAVAVVSGELTNASARTRDYTVFVTVDRDTEIFTLDSIPAGETVGWTVTTTAPRSGRDCDVEVVVQGPFPFGVEIDPIDP